MSGYKILEQYLKRPGEIGSVWASSRALAEHITNTAEVATASRVIELGPGTGAITEVILENLPDDSTFICFEINRDLTKVLSDRFPGLKIVEQSACGLHDYMTENGEGACDAIVSGLPFASFDEDLQEKIIRQAYDTLAPGGKFVIFSYIHSPYTRKGQKFREKLTGTFDNCKKTPLIWNNLPPAFTYCATK